MPRSKLVMNKVENKKFPQAMRGDDMHPRCIQKFACKMHPKVCMQDASKNVHSRYPLVELCFAPYALPKSVLLHCILVD